MEWAKKDDAFAAKVRGGLEKFLTRDADRQVFGLKPVAGKKKKKKDSDPDTAVD